MRPFKNKGLRIKTLVLLFFLIIVSQNGMAQESSKKELKEKEKAVKAEATIELIDSKTFTFKATTAIARGGRTVNLTSNSNFIKFSPDMVESSMPFFGQSTGAGHYGNNDVGLKFKGKPEIFNVEKVKKKYNIRVEVKGSNDNFKINLTTASEGNSTITITSNQKSVMTYYGRISKD